MFKKLLTHFFLLFIHRHCILLLGFELLGIGGAEQAETQVLEEE